MTDEPKNIVESTQNIVETLSQHHVILNESKPDAPFLVTVPVGRTVQDLTPHIHKAAATFKPIRLKGTAKMSDVESLIQWTNRFKDQNSALFCNTGKTEPSLKCISNYHEERMHKAPNQNLARCADHQAVYTFPKSNEWITWNNISGQKLTNEDLGEFIEAHATDIVQPTPSIIKGSTSPKNTKWENDLIETAQHIEGRYGQLHELLSLSRKFKVCETSEIKIQTNRDTGEGEIQLLSEHKTAEGKPVRIPNLIIIAIPVFKGGDLYRIPVRFRYQKRGLAVSFSLTLFNPHKAFEHAVEEVCTHVKKQTKLPLFMGVEEDQEYDSNG